MHPCRTCNSLLFGWGRCPDGRWQDSSIEDNYWLLHKLSLFSTGLDTAPLELQLYNNFSINKSVMRTYLSNEKNPRQAHCLGGNFVSFQWIKLVKNVQWCCCDHLRHLTAREWRVPILPQSKHIWLVRPIEFASANGCFFFLCGPAINWQLVQSGALLAVIGHLTTTWPL